MATNRHRFFRIALLTLMVGAAVCTTQAADKHGYRSFNHGWYFHLGDIANGQTASTEGWRQINLPHDWSVEDLPNQTPDSIVGPFDKGAIGAGFTGFVRGGIGWYRNSFTLSTAEKDASVSLMFDGVFMHSEVWVNGQYVGLRPSGYAPFNYDITKYLRPAGQENVVAVKVSNEGVTGRWYSGSGIYRNVTLRVTNPVHVANWGVCVRTPQVTKQSADVEVSTLIENSSKMAKTVTLSTSLRTPDGKTINCGKQDVSLKTGGETETTQTVRVALPKLWSPDTPYLYTAVTEIRQGKTLLDTQETTFGIRSIEFSAEKGFLLNGERTILRGGCVHHDNGPIGAASFERSEYRKIEKLKANGYNAIRTSHNPPSTLLLEACDRLGMLVLDEAFDVWTVEKSGNPQDFHLYFKDWWERDLTNMILRDRNHPSVIIWSVGNEIPERVKPEGVAITKQLAEKTRQLDPTRPVTEAFCRYQEQMNAGTSWNATAEPMALLDIAGYNYLGERYYAKDHQKYPQRMMIGTEIYPDKSLINHTTAEECPWILGDFIWTAIDYMGEVAVGRSMLSDHKEFAPLQGWPWYNAFCGDIDLLGNDKPQAAYRKVVWRVSPIEVMVHAPIPAGWFENISQWGWPDERRSWTWDVAEGDTMSVNVYSRAQAVRLYLNGRLVGERAVPENSVTVSFRVPYAKGELKAVNVVDGKEAETSILTTVGKADRISLISERTSIKADESEIAYIDVALTDANGKADPNMAEQYIDFKVEGQGQLIAVGNANPKEPMSFQGRRCHTFQGRCVAIVRSTGKVGKVTLTATAENMKPATSTIEFK